MNEEDVYIKKFEESNALPFAEKPQEEESKQPSIFERRNILKALNKKKHEKAVPEILIVDEILFNIEATQIILR